jgi:two-component sensor histidine kinase
MVSRVGDIAAHRSAATMPGQERIAHPSRRQKSALRQQRSSQIDAAMSAMTRSGISEHQPELCASIVLYSRMVSDPRSLKETALEAENAGLRDLLTQAGIDAARILKQAGIDATENEVAKRLQHLLLEELHHRVKNTLATVISITSQSLRNAASLEEGRLAVESRLIALGRAHDLLLEAHFASAKLADVIRFAIKPFETRDVSRFAVQDTTLEVGPNAVLPITLSLNELCTNAVKYGALSNGTGRIDIGSVVDEKNLKLTWIERGGPPVREPMRRSFGTRLIRRLAEQLHGEVRLKYEPAGLVYELDVPVSALRAPAA